MSGNEAGRTASRADVPREQPRPDRPRAGDARRPHSSRHAHRHRARAGIGGLLLGWGLYLILAVYGFFVFNAAALGFAGVLGVVSGVLLASVVPVRRSTHMG